MDFIEVAKTFGIPVALLAFFVWRDWKGSQARDQREDDLTARVRVIEDYQRNKLEQLVVVSTRAIEKSSEAVEAAGAALESVAQTNDRLLTALRLRPCIGQEIRDRTMTDAARSDAQRIGA
jgi:hypothetical protein